MLMVMETPMRIMAKILEQSGLQEMTVVMINRMLITMLLVNIFT